MSMLAIDEFCDHADGVRELTLEDYEGDTPRWCTGCGDFGVLTAVQRVLRSNRVDPDRVVCVSGIGCSSRFPHYLGTYGFHGIHGRALTLATGVALTRPDLAVLVVMGDGDCFSIGAGHWMHAMHYNVDLTALVLDNEIYALTKKQVSPTTPRGTSTSTTPDGAFLEPINPLSLVLGIANTSFVAQTATWLGGHCEATIAKAWEHRGMSFVRILQRCPAFAPRGFGEAGKNFSARFLESDDGIPVHKGLMKNALTVRHDASDLQAALALAAGDGPTPFGLLYRNPAIPTYQQVRWAPIQDIDNPTLVKKLNEKIGEFVVS